MKFTQRGVVAATAVAGLVCTAVALAPVAGAAPASGSTPAAASSAAPAKAAPAKAAPAKTAKAAAAYNNACGTGYGVVNSAPIGSTGTVYLTYSAKTKKNCVVTVRTKPGTAVHMTASLGLGSHTADVVDQGNYTTYAGPVYLSAPAQCVSWRGEIAGSVAGKNQTNCAALAR
ncbi:spore-associated protein A [Streptomyces sp. NBC_01497]|uniref:spore-associated protein A n=1 Tax=Streptomyces sp. NBC_01497 TaxID=2903885 RepID=UPI002E31307E|nr:spore-associated protein A [Streptomyces sp. NBC_01497]